MPAKYGYLLEDVNVRRWYENVARGSKVTADVYLRRLGAFCKSNDLTPDMFVSFNEEQIQGVMFDCVSSMEKRGCAGSYIESAVKSIRSWLSFNRKDLHVRLKIMGARDTPSLKNERIPTKEELKKIFLSSDKKARAASVLVAHSGLRIEVLGNYSGNDGLKISDLPEMVIKDDTVEFTKIPAMVIVRKELSKARHQFFTFLSEEGCEYLKDYLEERIRQGEKLTPESPIITPKMKMKPFIRTMNISDTIRVAIRKAGFRSRPYVLRSYFDTQLMLAESKGLVLRDYRTFWMGHKGDIENRYTTNKQKLTEQVVEDMREAYKRSQEFLVTTKKETLDQDIILATFNRQFLSIAGYTDDEINELGDLSKFAPQQLQELFKRKSMQALGLNGNSRQRIVPINEVKNWILQGWEYIRELPTDEAIIRLPTH